MPASRKILNDFAPIKWATPFLTSPEWDVRERSRAVPDGITDADRFCNDTMRAFDGIQHWIELYQKPLPGSKAVTKSISLCKFGTGLHGFPSICHGGAVMTFMDEALGYLMVASESERQGQWIDGSTWRQAFEEKRSPAEILKGFMVTAKMDMKFLKPVLCPGVVGIEVELLENTGNKMKLRGVMKDGNGMPLVQCDGLWVRIGRVPTSKI